MTPRATSPIAQPSSASSVRARSASASSRSTSAGVGDHRRHDLDRAGRSRPIAGAELGHEEVRLGGGEAEGSDAEERIGLGGDRQVRDRLVAADVEQPDRDRMRGERPDRALVGRALLVLRRRARPLEEEELGPEQADPLRAQGDRRVALVRRADVRDEGDGDPVARDRRKAGFDEVLLVALPAGSRGGVEAADRRLVRVDEDVAGGAIDRQLGSATRLRGGGEGLEQVAHADDGRNAVRPGEDRGVGRGRRAREGDAEETVPRKGRGQRRREVVGDDDRRPIETDRGLDCPGESAGDPVADVDDVRGPRREQLVLERSKLLGERFRRRLDGARSRRHGRP